MAYADLPFAELRAHVTIGVEPADLDAFWADSLREARSHDLAPVFTPTPNGLVTIDSYSVSFPGFGGQPVAGWLQVPARAEGALPCVVQYVGYGGGRGLVHETRCGRRRATPTSSWTPGARGLRGPWGSRTTPKAAAQPSPA